MLLVLFVDFYKVGDRNVVIEKFKVFLMVFVIRSSRDFCFLNYIGMYLIG